MWKCHKCGKPVYFAERKQSLGYDWHPECLRCEECGKRLNPGQHAEHKGVPYCHVPCYGALFGPQLFGHGTRVESHKSFGQKGTPKVNSGPSLPRSHLESKLKVFNQFYDGKSGEVRSREVNGRLVLEGALRIHWGVQGVIHLKEDDDQRTVVTIRKRNSCRYNNGIEIDGIDDVDSINDEETQHQDNNHTNNKDEEEVEVLVDEECPIALNIEIDSGLEDNEETMSETKSEASPNGGMTRCSRSVTLPPKLNLKTVDWDELDDFLQVERRIDDSDKLYRTMPAPLPSQGSQLNSEQSTSFQLSPSQAQSMETSQFSITPDTEHNSLLLDYDTENSENLNDTSIDSTNTESTNDSEWTLPDDSNWIEHSIHLNRSMSGPDCLERIRDPSPEFDDLISPTEDGVVLRRPAKTGSTAIKRRPGKRLSRGTKLKRRCSINGHFYNRETSFFTPPHGSQMSVWVTSLVNTQEVINLMLEKYKVDSHYTNFALFVIRDNGEQRRLKDDEYPLLVRVLLGPHEDVSRLFLMDRNSTPEVSNEVAQFLNLSLVECRAIICQYDTEENREINRTKEKYFEMKRRIKQRMEDLKVRL